MGKREGADAFAGEGVEDGGGDAVEAGEAVIEGNFGDLGDKAAEAFVNGEAVGAAWGIRVGAVRGGDRAGCDWRRGRVRR